MTAKISWMDKNQVFLALHAKFGLVSVHSDFIITLPLFYR